MVSVFSCGSSTFFLVVVSFHYNFVFLTQSRRFCFLFLSCSFWQLLLLLAFYVAETSSVWYAIWCARLLEFTSSSSSSVVFVLVAIALISRGTRLTVHDLHWLICLLICLRQQHQHQIIKKWGIEIEMWCTKWGNCVEDGHRWQCKLFSSYRVFSGRQ